MIVVGSETGKVTSGAVPKAVQLVARRIRVSTDHTFWPVVKARKLPWRWHPGLGTGLPRLHGTNATSLLHPVNVFLIGTRSSMRNRDGGRSTPASRRCCVTIQRRRV